MHARALPLLLLLAPGVAGFAVLLHVDDGDHFYDTDHDCIGDTDTSPSSIALHHWHYGAPNVDAEATGGFGCLEGPRTWSLVVPDGAVASVRGSLRYQGDIHFNNNAANDVHLLALDATGEVVRSTLAEQGWAPAIQRVEPTRTREVAWTLPAGTYLLREDVASGAHTVWLTKLTVSVST